MCHLCPEDKHNKIFPTHIKPCSCKSHRDDIGGDLPAYAAKIREWYDHDSQWVSSVTGEVLPSRQAVVDAIDAMDAYVKPLVDAARDRRKTGAQLASIV